MSAKEATTTPVLEARGLVAGYLPGVDILRGCDLQVAEGELVGVIGPNGAGKSTLVKALFGIVPVREGSVLLRGEDVTGRKGHDMVRSGIGYVPQTRNVFGALTVADNLRMGSYLAPDKLDVGLAAVEELFPLLLQRRSDRADRLSGGQRQMLAVARALMAEPTVLLLDEPSAGLSPALQDEVFAWVETLNAAGTAVVMVEQNARRCLQICHRGYVLDEGTNAYTATGQELLHDPKVIELYLGALARVD